MSNGLNFSFKAKVWLYPGKAGWHFVTIAGKTSKELKIISKTHRRGWGSMPVMVTIGKTKFSTSVFPDAKSNGFLLPIKKEVRIKENIKEGSNIGVSISFDVIDI